MSTQNVPAVDTGLEDQNRLVRETYGRGLTDPEFRLLIAAAEHEGLDVIAGDMSAIKFGDGGAAVNYKKIGGLRKLADRSGLLADFEGPFFCDKSGQWTEVWLDDKNPPVAAKFTVWRSDRSRPITAVAIWSERVQRKRDGGLMPNWRSMPSHMLGKVAEADAYRKARLVPDNRFDFQDPNARQKAYGRLHAVAEAQGLSHDQARAVVAQLSPGAESLTEDDVSVEDLHDAASMIEALGADALTDDDDLMAGIDDDVVDDQTGELIAPSPREQWRAQCREAIQASDSAAVKALWFEAGKEDWKWQVIIEEGMSLAFVNRCREIAVKRGIRAESADAWVQTWKDAEAIRGQNRSNKAAESATLPGMPVDRSHLTK